MKDKIINATGIQGLNRDSTFQNPNQVTFALNAIRNSHDGGQPEYQSEPGNLQVDFLPNGQTMIGKIYGQNNEWYIFSTNGSGDDAISLFKQDFNQPLVQADLGFSLDYPITGEYRIRNGCDRVIYWEDYLNRDRWFNVDKPELFKTLGVFDSNKFDFSPSVTIPNIDLVEVLESGGNLPLGSYYFQVEMLDSSNNIVFKSDLTPQTVIYDESQNAVYPTIDGAVNYPQFDANAGGVPPTNKSIHLQFTNVDTTFKYLRIKVAYQTTANQVLQAHQVGELIPITSSTIDWIYVGYNVNSGDSQLDYTEMLIPLFNYNSSYVMEQVQNRLVRANLKEINRNYAEYQIWASGITTNWVASESDTKQVTLGNPKDARTYWYKTNFVGDEVYALGVQALHTDGTWSPALHIPGRVSTGLDTVLLTVVSNATPTPSPTQVWESDVKHLGLIIGDTVAKWKVFNTATVSSSQVVTHPYTYKGIFGYYEADFNYPDIKDCDGNLIWGSGITTSTPVRFHKFPDRRLIPHINDEDHIVQLGIEFTVPAYPNSDIVGHRFCHISRDEFNQTVSDTGWTSPANVSSDILRINGYYASDNNTDKAVYLSPEVNFNKSVTPASYIKQNKVYKFDTNTIANPSASVTFKSINDHNIRSAIVYTNDLSFSTPLRTNYKVNKQYFSPAGTATQVDLLGYSIDNQDFLTDASVIEIDDNFENYIPFNGGQSVGSFVVTGDYFIKGNMVYTNKKVLNRIYSNFLNLRYQYIHLNPQYGAGISQFFGGDTLITANQLFRLSEYTMYVFNEDTADNYFETVLMDMLWCETKLATMLRYEGTLDATTYFKRGDTDLQVMKKFTTVIEGTGDSFKLQFKPRQEWLTEYYQLNPDYELQSNELTKLSLVEDYDYCSQCSNIYTNRIVFSPVSFDEENIDYYRTTLANDYIDIPGHRGQITGLKYRDNRLLVHCEDATFILQPNPQVISTDQNEAYLSTGDFLSIPPQELIQTDIGFAGCQNKQHQADSPFGHHWIDQRRGQIFSFDNQLSEISSIGLTQWFKENLPSEIQRAVWDYNHDKYPFQNTTSVYGVGCILYYDPRFKRLILSKTDYLPIGQVEDPVSGLYWNAAVNLWQVYNSSGVVTLTPVFTSTTRFENKSWTLSFDFSSWTSWHSYIPYNAFSDDFNYYTVSKANQQPDYIYKHLDKERYQNFYTTKYDFVIEYQAFDLSTDRLHTIHYVGYTYQWDQSNKDWLLRDKTFDKVICYNNNQSTGYQTLNLKTNPYSNIFLNNSSKFVIKTDQNYKIAGLRDMSINQPVMTRDWDLTKLYPGYIDKVPNTPNINYNKSIYNQGMIWDKFVNVRLFFKPAEDYKKIVILTNINEFYSTR